jgi:subtilisin family serine protease
LKSKLDTYGLGIFWIFLLSFILVSCKQNDDGAKADVVPWGQELVGFETKITENKVKIVVIDSGIDSSHPDLNGKIKQSYSVLTNRDVTNDEMGHGTSIAGIITANYDEHGIVGVSQNVELFDVKVLDETGKSKVDDIVAGLEWALQQNPDIINISFGFDKEYASIREIIDFANEKNITVVAAAGNNIGGEIQYPAAYDNVISVGSLNEKKEEDILNPEGNIDFLAPGIDIYTTAINGDYHTVRGSSFATAYITGILSNALTSRDVSKYDSLENKKKYLQDILEY